MSQPATLHNEDPAATDLPARGQLLIIDDEEQITKALYRQFRRKYDVYMAVSAQEGYEIMTQTQIQVVISDQRMPEITGSEFFQRIKGEFPDAIRLLLTGYADIEAVIAAINDGNVFRYITKPWDPVELDSIVEQAFERYTLLVENRALLDRLRRANQELEQRVEERTRDLEEANTLLRSLHKQKDSFIGMVAHDLRNPTASIFTSAFFLLDDRFEIDAEEMNEILNDIRTQADYMLKLIDDLLDVSQIETGELTLRYEVFDLADFLQTTVQRHAQLATKKDIAVTHEPILTSPVVADPMRLRQVLDNLIDNAVKYSPPGSRVDVTARQADDEMWHIRVQDEGPGISADDQAKLFQFFGRASSLPTGDERSTGLGLAIARRVVQAHGGEIGVDSAPGEGAAFWFTLPHQPDLPPDNSQVGHTY